MKCGRCGEQKPVDDFFAGWTVCMECVQQEVVDRESGAARRRRDRQRYYRKVKDPEAVQQKRDRDREWRRRNKRIRDPARVAVHNAVRNAVRRGDIVPSETCDDCGHDFSEHRRDAHHEDNSKPLDVEWLCIRCHAKRHRKREVR